MSRIFTAKDICERSLRLIGAFPVTESAPDGEQLREAMTWLDLIMAQVVGTERMFSRVPSTMSMTITNGTQDYILYTALGSELPTDRIQFVVSARVDDDLGNRSAVEIVNREKFENVADSDANGDIEWIYIDRTTSPTLSIRRVPAITDPRTYTLKLVGQRFAPNVAPGGITGTQPSGSVLHDFGQAWQRFLIFQLAHDLGTGAIHKLPESSLTRFAGVAVQAKQALDAFENREHQTTPPICESWGMII